MLAATFADRQALPCEKSRSYVRRDRGTPSARIDLTHNVLAVHLLNEGDLQVWGPVKCEND